ncbi:MAG: hypothetical protein GY930_17645, partial [bacterium]|nr:hypothetical protein [bacterium]
MGQILKGAGAVGEGDVQAALADQRKHGGLIGQCLVARGACTDAQVASALAEQAGLKSVDLTRETPEPEALELVDGSVAHTFLVLPLRIEDGELVVALADPLNQAVLEDLAFTTGRSIRGTVASVESLRAAVVQHYGEEADLAS